MSTRNSACCRLRRVRLAPLLLLACLAFLPRPVLPIAAASAPAEDECSPNDRQCVVRNDRQAADAGGNPALILAVASPADRQEFHAGVVKLDALLFGPGDDLGKICFKYANDPDCRGIATDDRDEAEGARRALTQGEQYAACSPSKVQGNMQLAAGCWAFQFDSIGATAAGEKVAETKLRSVVVATVDGEVRSRYPTVPRIPGGEAGMVRLAVAEMMKGGLVLEFGTGRTTAMLSHFRSVEKWDTMKPVTQGVHTFDSFRGLPEPWREGFDRGRFSMQGVVPPSILDLPNVQVHHGLVQETLPPFLEARPSQPVGLLLLDMCLDSSTTFVLDQVVCRLAKGSIVLFGNYFNYPGWIKTMGERTAWLSAVDRWGIDFEYLGYHAYFFALKVTKKPRRCPSASLDIRPFRRLGNISVESFERHYARPDAALPTIFGNITDDVFEASRWTRQALADVCGDNHIVQRYKNGCSGLVGSNRSCHYVRTIDPDLFGKQWGGLGDVDVDDLKIETVHDLLSMQDSENGSDSLVLFDAPLLHHCPAARDWIRVPKYFSRDYYLIGDWMENKNPVDTRNWPSVIVSKKGKGTFIHADAGMTRFWAQQLSGSKLWRVFPPSENWRLYPTGGLHHFYPVAFKADAMKPDFDKFPLLDGAIVYETIIEPGEVLFIPEGWAHQVLNLEDSVSTGMNFLDNHCLETASKHGKSVLPVLVDAFFMPLDNPTRHNPEENIEFNDYFQFRFLRHEERVPMAVKRWVQEKGKDAINSEWNANGEPALHVAVFFDFLAVVKYLLDEGGADVNAKSRSGLTALDVAENYGRQEIRDLLIRLGGQRGSTLTSAS